MTDPEPHLLIIWHSRTGGSKALAKAAATGAGKGARALKAQEVSPDDLLDAAAYLFICPENLGTMSGEMKEMFDRCYYPVLGKIEGRPFATIIAAGSDGTGAQVQLDRIVTGWRLRRVADPAIVNFAAQSPAEILASKSLKTADRKDAADLGEALATGVAMGVF